MTPTWFRFWLFLGAGLLIAAQMRWPVFLAGWLAPLPFLIALRHRRTARQGWEWVAVYMLAWVAATLKIITPPLSPFMALGFALPIGLIHMPAFWLWDRLVRKGQHAWAILAFASATAVLEWLQATFTPLTSWGASALTQLDNLPLLQLAALGGLPLLALLLNALPATLEWAGSRAFDRRSRWALALFGLLFLVAHGWGTLRLATPLAGPQVRVAAVATDARFSGPPLPGAAEVKQFERTLFERTEKAAGMGARLVVWPEGSTLVQTSQEAEFLARVSELARRLHVELIAAYVVPLSDQPFRYENKYHWFDAEGRDRETYFKHVPVPGEPAVAGTSPHRAHQAPWGRMAGAICYDYDVPPLARTHARLGVDLVALPSSDWAGIDPIHTQMAGIRAIEGGFSLLRSTRLGLSAGMDAHGRMRAWMTDLEPNEGVMLASLPMQRLATPYSRLGDWVIVPSLAVLTLVFGRLWTMRRRRWGARVADLAPERAALEPAQGGRRPSV